MKVLRAKAAMAMQTMSTPGELQKATTFSSCADCSLRSQQNLIALTPIPLMPGTLESVSQPATVSKFTGVVQADLVADQMYLRTGPNSGVVVNNPVAGQPYYVHFDWRNTGSTAANNFRLEIKFNGSVICFNNAQNANPNTSNITWCSAAVTWPIGNNTIEGALDVNNVIVETNESNNTASRIYTASAELVADRMYLRTGPNSGVEVDNPIAGQQYYIHFDWRNTGSGSANNFRAEIKLNGSVQCFNNAQSAGANTSNITWCTIAVTWPAGNNTIEGVLDVNNVISEANENNNGVSRAYAGSPTIVLNPTSFQFTATQGGSNPASQTLNISNTGGATLNWTGSDDATWLSLSSTSGTVSAGGNQNTTVSVNIVGLAAGTYNATITVSDPNATNNPQTASVTLTVNPPSKPTIVLNPTAFNFTATQGGSNPASQTLNISNTGNATLNWTGSDDATWLSLSPTSGTVTAGGNQNTTISVNIAGLASGTYNATIIISDPNATNNPQTASVTLTIQQQAELVADRVYLRTGPNSGVEVDNPVAGQQYYLHFDWRNTGGTAGDSRVELKLNGTVICGYNTGTIAGNSTQKTWCTSAISWSSGANTIEGVLDVNNVIPEANENNNAVNRTYAGSPTIVLNPTNFLFTATQGGSNPASQTLNIRNIGNATLNWSGSDNATWFTLSPTSGSISAGGNQNTTVSVNIAGLASGTYNATITVSDPNATNNPQTAPVTLTVQPPTQKPTIVLNPAAFQFTAAQGGSNPASQTLNISNTGNATLNWTGSDDATWLSLSPTIGSVSAGGNQNTMISVNIAGLAAGTYNATITISDPNATNNPQTASITLTVQSPTPKPTIALNPAAFQFTATQGGSNPVSQTLNISNTGNATLNWSGNDDATWLSLSSTGGTVPAGGNQNTTVSVNIAGLAAGTYNAKITVSDPNATTNPQTASVTLTVQSPTPKPTIALNPAAFQFTATQGGSNPASQTLNISNTGNATLNWTATANATWLNFSPTGGLLPVAGSQNVSLSVNVAGLAVGTFNGKITVSDPNATNSPQAVTVDLIITASSDSVKLRVVPNIAHVITGNKVSIDIKIEKAKNLGSFEFTLNFDTATVQVEAAAEVTLGPFLGSSGRSSLPVGPTINNTAGTITFGGISFGTQPGPNGDGILATIRFKGVATRQDTTDLAFKTAQITNTDGVTQSLTDRISGKIRVSPQCADVDSDCDVDVFDVQSVAGRWNTQRGDSRYDSRYDLDAQCQGDGDIDVVDIQLCASQWRWKCPSSAGTMISKATNGSPVNIAIAIGPRNNDGTFDLLIHSETAAELAAFEVSLLLPKNWSVRSFTPGDFLAGNGNAVLPLQKVDSEGRLHVGAVSYGSRRATSGSGLLMRLNVAGDPQRIYNLLVESAQFAGKNGEPLAAGKIDLATPEMSAVPKELALYPNHPNPFWSGATSRLAGNPTTVIRFDLPATLEGEIVELSIYNLHGEKIRELVRAPLSSGHYRYEWDGRDARDHAVGSGVYFSQLTAGTHRQVRKLSLVK